MKKTIIRLFYILLSTAFLVLLIIILHVGIINRTYGFKRKIVSEQPKLLHSLTVDHIGLPAGHTATYFFFNSKTPGLFYAYDWKNNSIKLLNYAFHHDEKTNSRFKLQIDSPIIFLFAGNVPRIDVSNFNHQKKYSGSYTPYIFNRSTALSKNQIVLKILKDSLGLVDQFFAIYHLKNQKILNEHGITTRKGDFGFSSDGMLHVDQKNQQIIFVEFYTNKIISLDTNLRLLSRWQSIDTLTINQTQYRNSKSTKNFTNSSPQRVINLFSTVAEGKLYLASNRLADHQQISFGKAPLMIDCYDIASKKYLNSFYLPRYQNKNAKALAIAKNIMVVLYKDHLSTYRLP